MAADGADFGRLLADADVAAVGALPNHVSVAGENKTSVYVGKQLFITLLVGLFDFAHLFEKLGNVVKALGPCLFGKTLIHIGPFEVFARRRIGKIVCGAVYARKEFKPNFCVLLFVCRGFLEKLGNLNKAFLFRL